MLVNVPQFIGVEDKIVGPLTAKQLGWLALGGVILLVLWGILDTQALILGAIFDAAIFGALAFYRPYNQPLINFIFSSISFVSRPKVYIWQRLTANTSAKRISMKAPTKAIEKKTLDMGKINEVSQVLDMRNKNRFESTNESEFTNQRIKIGGDS